MERLQDALSRARDRRQELGTDKKPSETAPKPQDRPEKPRDPQTGSGVSAAWQSLPQFTPNEKLLRNNRIVSYFGGPTAHPFDMMRTKLLQQTKANTWKRIAITSPTSGCGKSTIAANLAFSLARQSELRILVIEIDMRRPQLANILGIKENHAFSRVLGGHEPAEAHMVAYGNNLAFGTNRVPSANSSEILHSNFAKAQLDKVEAMFAPDLVLYDAPPILASDDTIGFLDYVDAAILIAAAELTSIDEVDICETEIASATNVMGVVLNKARYMPSGQGYDSNYY
jgi:Mrp family chromosome partitioning ATPase